MGSCGVVGITCGCGRNLMLAAFKVAHMSCTQRQRGGAAERGEAHVGGRGSVGWSGVVGIACGYGSGRNKKRDGRRGSTSMDKLSCLLTHALHTAHCKEQ